MRAMYIFFASLFFSCPLIFTHFISRARCFGICVNNMPLEWLNTVMRVAIEYLFVCRKHITLFYSMLLAVFFRIPFGRSSQMASKMKTNQKLYNTPFVDSVGRFTSSLFLSLLLTLARCWFSFFSSFISVALLRVDACCVFFYFRVLFFTVLWAKRFLPLWVM